VSIESRTGGVIAVVHGGSAAAPCVRTLVPGRGVVVVDVSDPGRPAAARTIAAVVAAARARGCSARVERLDGRRDVIVAALPGLRRPRRIPRDWLGEHIVLVTGGDAERALAELVRATGEPEGGDVVSLAARVCAHAFASTTIIVDPPGPRGSTDERRFGPLREAGSR
jgi:hypothetical protein